MSHYTIWSKKNNVVTLPGKLSATKAFSASVLKASPSFHATIAEMAKDGVVVAKLIQRAFQYASYCHPKISRNYFSMREKDGEISFTPKGKELIVSENGTWSRKGRQSVRPVPWAKSVLNPRITKRISDSHFKTFADRFKVEETKEKDEFEFVGFDVAYSSNDNSVGSCMVDKPVKEFYETMGAKILVHRQKGSKVIDGRAIIWPEVELHRNGEEVMKFPFMDRIYGSDQVILKFKQWAELNEYAFKRQQSTNSPDVIFEGTTYNLNNEVGDLRVYHKDGNIPDSLRWYPYIDTFGHQSITDIPYLTTKTEGGTWAYQYWNTGGNRTHSGYQKGFIYDKTIERWVDPSDMIIINGNTYKKGDRQIVQLATIDGTDTPRYGLCTDSIVTINQEWYLTSDPCLFTCAHSGQLCHERDQITIAGKVMHRRYAIYYQVNLDNGASDDTVASNPVTQGCTETVNA